MAGERTNGGRSGLLTARVRRDACSHILLWMLRLSPLLAGLLPGSVAAEGVAPSGASSCTGCHPPSAIAGSLVPPLDGRPVQATIAALQAFRSGSTPATVMDRIVKGFTDAEIEAIAQWFAERK